MIFSILSPILHRTCPQGLVVREGKWGALENKGEIKFTRQKSFLLNVGSPVLRPWPHPFLRPTGQPILDGNGSNRIILVQAFDYDLPTCLPSEKWAKNETIKYHITTTARYETFSIECGLIFKSMMHNVVDFPIGPQVPACGGWGDLLGRGRGWRAAEEGRAEGAAEGAEADPARPGLHSASRHQVCNQTFEKEKLRKPDDTDRTGWSAFTAIPLALNFSLAKVCHAASYQTRKRFYSSSQVQLLPRADNPCRIPSLTCVATAGLSRWRRRRRGSSRVWRRPSRCGNRVFLWIEHGTTLALAVAVRKGEAAAQ